jgi:hypothetical protein
MRPDGSLTARPTVGVLHNLTLVIRETTHAEASCVAVFDLGRAK